MSRKVIYMSILLGGLLACNPSTEATNKSRGNEASEIIGKVEATIAKDIMTPEVLYSFGRVGGPILSPDGSRLVYPVTYVSIDQNKTNAELFVMKSDGSEKKQLTITNTQESNPQWIDGGKKIAFLSNETGTSQIWSINPDGGGMKQLSRFGEDIEGFAFSPDGTKVLFIKQVKTTQTAADRYPDLPAATGRVVDDLMYKHWDHWVASVPHPFVADLVGNKLENVKDLLEGEPFEAPMAPFGGMEQLAWSPDSKTIAYTSRKKTGKEYSLSTNSDIFLYDVASGQARNITEGMEGYDTNPQFSPDGTKIAWLSMERDGYESDKNRLFVMDLTTGEKTYLTQDFDYNTDAFSWENNNTLYIVTPVQGTTQLYKVELNTLAITPITKGYHDYTSVAVANGKLIAGRQSLSQPTELYSVDIATGEATNISQENTEILANLTMGRVEERWIETTDGKQMLTWVVYPPHFDPSKKYPALLYCQGGPQSMVSQFWSYRWNLQMMAANGYIVVAPNRRGLPGFGQEWLEQISGDYGGQNMKDYLAAIDALAKESFIDETRLGCTGASYGGFSVYWLAGNHNGRFKAFLSHAGIFNLEAQYLETEEMWFANWDLGGPYWDTSNATAQRTYANSPHRFVEKWDTPIMITHGELDYRILASQGMMAFNAAQLRGIPSRMLIFPNENHWISKPQNGVLFQREFFRWFNQWLKPGQSAAATE
jgi:dipeptidyl aminopeptidase/acylaminoacyl peptidase